MFAHRIRTAALALAGAAFAASILFVPVGTAAAATPDSADGVVLATSSSPQPAKPDSTSEWTIPATADAAVTFVGSWTSSDGSKTYAFHVVNNGPTTDSIHITKTLDRSDCQYKNDAPSCHVGQDVTAQTMYLHAGGSYEAVINCKYRFCVAKVEVKPDHAYDPKKVNNTAVSYPA